MVNFSDVKYEEFKELIDFLKFNDEDNEAYNITKRLTRFIVGLSATQSIMITNMVSDIIAGQDCELDFNNFQESFPDLQFDPEGKQDLTNFQYYEIALQSIEILYETAQDKIKNGNGTNIDWQICNAKTLEPLLKLDGKYQYIMRKQVYFKNNHNVVITQDQLKTVESQLKELVPNNQSIVDKFFYYITEEKPERVHFFIDHFLYRLDVLSKDKNIEANANKEFYNNLKKIN